MYLQKLVKRDDAPPIWVLTGIYRALYLLLRMKVSFSLSFGDVDCLQVLNM